MCVWSHLAGFFLEGNWSICYKKAACDLTPGPCCSLPLSARRARDIEVEEGEREMKWDGGQKDGGAGRRRGRDAKTEGENSGGRRLWFFTSHVMKVGPCLPKGPEPEDLMSRQSARCRVIQAAPVLCNEGEAVLKN